MIKKSSAYTDLLVKIEPRPITSKAALDLAYKQIEQLMSKPKLSRDESQMLELLSILAEQYESREHPTPRLSAIDVLQHLIESRGITNATLAAETQIPRSTITDILAGRRNISINNVRKFANYFGVSPSLFIAQ